MNKYTKEEFLKAAEIGEVSMIDARHIISLLDEAKAMIENKSNIPMRNKILEACKTYDRTVEFDSDFSKISLDSLDTIDMMMQVEKAMNVSFPTEIEHEIHTQQFKTVGDFIIYMEKLITAQAPTNQQINRSINQL